MPIGRPEMTTAVPCRYKWGSSRCLIECSKCSQSCPKSHGYQFVSGVVTPSAAQVQVQIPPLNIVPSIHPRRQDGTCQKGGVGRASKDSCGGRWTCFGSRIANQMAIRCRVFPYSSRYIPRARIPLHLHMPKKNLCCQYCCTNASISHCKTRAISPGQCMTAECGAISQAYSSTVLV